MINAIELSPHTEGTAYVAVTGYKLNDFKPYIYKTTDYGKRWRRIDEGIPDRQFVRVVREDPIRKGLLYAGTENGMFISLDDGRSWQPFGLNLPAVPITDIRARKDGLVVATQGRAFWILDDIFVVRQAGDDLGSKSLTVFKAPVTVQGRNSGNGGATAAANPSPDVPIYYHLNDVADEDAGLSITIRDAEGRRVKSYSSNESDHDRCRVRNMDPRRPFTLEHPTKKQGLNKWSWDMRTEDIPCIHDLMLHAGYTGPSVAPGRYTATVSIGNVSEAFEFTVTADPRSSATEKQTMAWVKTLSEIKTTLTDVLQHLDTARHSRRQVRKLLDDYQDDELQRLGNKAVEAINDWELKITQLKHETYEDEDAWETMLDGQLRFLMDVVDASGAPVTDGAKTRFTDLNEQWQLRQEELRSISADYLAPINQWANDQKVPHVPMSH